MIGPEKITELEEFSKAIGSVSEKERGDYALGAASAYCDWIKQNGWFGSEKNYSRIDCMDKAIEIAKMEYEKSGNKKGLEKLGMLAAEALSRKNAIECLRQADSLEGQGMVMICLLEKKSTAMLNYLEDECSKPDHIKLGLCDKFDKDYRGKRA